MREPSTKHHCQGVEHQKGGHQPGQHQPVSVAGCQGLTDGLALVTYFRQKNQPKGRCFSCHKTDSVL